MRTRTHTHRLCLANSLNKAPLTKDKDILLIQRVAELANGPFTREVYKCVCQTACACVCVDVRERVA